MKTLIFAEKPSVGRDIARILGVGQKHNGYLENDKFIVTWGFGHLVSIASPETQNPIWKRWSLQTLPMIPTDWKLSVLTSSAQQFKIVASLMKRKEVTEIVNAADAGREGELIFRLVYQLAEVNKPFKRLWISSMTDEAIKEGFANLKPGIQYDPLALAAICRSRADWLVGMNLTRVYTKKLDSMYTLGRVQTPTLSMVVTRYLEIKNFVPKDYWEIIADLGDFKAIWFDPKEKEFPSRIDKQSIAEDLAQKIKGQLAKISSVKKTNKSQPPPFLYDLTSLQRDANSKFSMTAADTLSVLQTLYEKKKLVTYPRTDSKHLSEDIFPTIEKRLAALPPDYNSLLEPLRTERPKKIKRVFDNKKVSDHHAIIPTEKKISSLGQLPPTERKIYDLIVKRFLAAFYPDYKYVSTLVLIDVLKEKFKATGRLITHEGWKAVYAQIDKSEEKIDEKKETEEDEQALPDLKKGDTRLVKDSQLNTKKTKPPSDFTEATLLQAMETAGKLVEDEELRDAMKDSGLGTPATRAEIIEKLIRVGYLLREKKKLLPTEKAIYLISIAAEEIKSPELTGNWEKRLTDIAKSTDNEESFMKDITSFVVDTVTKIKSDASFAASKPQITSQPQKNIKKIEKALAGRKILGKCPLCTHGNIIEGKKGFGCDRFKEGCHYVVWKEFFGKKITEKAIKTLIDGKTTALIKGFTSESGEKFSARLYMNKEKGLVDIKASE